MRSNQVFFRSSRARRTQGGFAILSVLLALAVAALMARSQFEADQIRVQLEAGKTEAQVLKQVAQAVNNYTMEFYPQLQNNLPISKHTLMLVPGSQPTGTLSPSIKQLIDMGFLPREFSQESLYIPGATFEVRLRREPTSCSGVNCNIPGVVYLSRPMTVLGTTQMNAPMVNGFVTEMGGDALVSTNVDPWKLAGPSVTSSPFVLPLANPLGYREGVVGSRAGFGAAGFGRFLTLNDPRDPNFLGDVTVQGTIESKTEISLTNTTDTCDIARIWTNASGVSEFLANSAACVRRAWVSADGTVGVADASGVRRADINGNNGNITSYAADGVTPRAGFTYNVLGQSEVYADNLRNNASTASGNAAGIANDGRVYGRLGQFNSVVLNTTAALNASCTQPNEMVWGTLNGNPLLMKCEGGRYVPTDGTSIATGGASCSPNGATAKTVAGVHLLCEGGIWKVTLQRIGRVQMDDSLWAGHGTSIAKPVCASGGTPVIMLLPSAINAATGVLTYRANDVGSSWLVDIRGNDGNPVSGSTALAHIYCSY